MKAVGYQKGKYVLPPVAPEKQLDMLKLHLVGVTTLVGSTNYIEFGWNQLALPRGGEMSRFCDICSPFLSQSSLKIRSLPDKSCNLDPLFVVCLQVCHRCFRAFFDWTIQSFTHHHHHHNLLTRHSTSAQRRLTNNRLRPNRFQDCVRLKRLIWIHRMCDPSVQSLIYQSFRSYLKDSLLASSLPISTQTVCYQLDSSRRIKLTTQRRPLRWRSWRTFFLLK